MSQSHSFIFTFKSLREHGEVALTGRSGNVFARKPFKNELSSIGTSRHDETIWCPMLVEGPVVALS